MSNDPIVAAFDAALSDFNTSGLPISGRKSPDKPEIRQAARVVAEALNAVRAAQTTDGIVYETWAALAAHPTAGLTAGKGAKVVGPDAGTHTDPVVDGSVANKGTYRWNASPVGWKRLGNLESDDAAGFAAAAASSADESEANAAAALHAVTPQAVGAAAEIVQRADQPGIGVSNNPAIFGWADVLEAAGPDFNRTNVPFFGLVTGGNVPVKLKGVIRKGAAGEAHDAGSDVVAVAETQLAEGGAPWINTPLDWRDPDTGELIDDVRALCGAGEIFRGVWGETAVGGLANISQPIGALADRVDPARSYYLGSGVDPIEDEWSAIEGATPIALENVQVTGREEGYASSAAFRASLEAQVRPAPTLALPAALHGALGREFRIYDYALTDRGRYDTRYRRNLGVGSQQDGGFLYTGPNPLADFPLGVFVHDRTTGQARTSAVPMLNVHAAPTSETPLDEVAIFLGDSTIFAGVVTGALRDIAAQTDHAALALAGTQGTGDNLFDALNGMTVARWFQPTGGDIALNPYSDGGAPFDFAFAMANDLSAWAGQVTRFNVQLGPNDIAPYTTAALAGVTITDRQDVLDETIRRLAHSRADMLEAMFASVHDYDADIKIGLGLCIPPNPLQDGFTTSNGDVIQTWRQHAASVIWNAVMIERFDGREAEGIRIAHINLGIDPVVGWPREATRSLRNAHVQVDGTFSTCAGMTLTPAAGALYRVTDVNDWFVKVGGPGLGTWRPAMEEDGVVRRPNDGLHCRPPGSGYHQIAEVWWSLMLADLA